MRLLFLLLLAVPLFGNAIVSVSITGCDTPGGTVTDPVSVQYHPGCLFPQGGDASGGGSASAADLSANVDTHASGPNAFARASAEASNSFVVDAPAPGLYTLSFSLAGTIIGDGGSGNVYFSITGDGLNGQWSQPGDGHYFPVDTMFTSSPVMLSAPFKYTADVRADATAYNVPWGRGSANVRAAFLGLNPVASGSGDEVPEPGSFVLLSVPLAWLMLRQFCKTDTPAL